jgi:hypothetical protein
MDSLLFLVVHTAWLYLVVHTAWLYALQFDKLFSQGD